MRVAPRLAQLDASALEAGAAPAAVYENVCVGGTFDYMHVGHKLLLSLSAHTCSQRLVVGVSGAPLLKKKVRGAARWSLPSGAVAVAALRARLATLAPPTHASPWRARVPRRCSVS